MWTVEFSFYKDAYWGTAITEDKWVSISRISCAYIDKITYGRLQQFSDIPEEVQLAVCAVADVIHAQHAAERHQSEAAGVKSFNNDGYSETLVDAAQLSKDFARRKADAAAVYLPCSHPLRYAGV